MQEPLDNINNQTRRLMQVGTENQLFFWFKRLEKDSTFWSMLYKLDIKERKKSLEDKKEDFEKKSYTLSTIKLY